MQKSYDHLGNEYRSQTAMCETYHISKQAFQRRLSNGWTLKEALTTPPGGEHTVYRAHDHTGKGYKTKEDMCRAYGISQSTYNKRKEKGMSLKNILTTPAFGKGNGVTDHLGNHYRNTNQMCEAYGIQEGTYQARIGKGMTKEEALTKPTRKKEIGLIQILTETPKGRRKNKCQNTIQSS